MEKRVMSIGVHLTFYFSDIVNGHTYLKATGTTVRDVIEDIDQKYQGFKQECIDEQGKLYGFLEVYINLESAFPGELDREVKDGDEINILTMMGGG
jgi:molybdopterin synthase sulfur carrier subunit